MNNSKEYAKALFALATEQQSVNTYSAELSGIGKLISEEPQYLEMLGSPALPLSERLGFIDEAFGSLDEMLVSFLKLVCENGHIKELPLYIAEFFMLKEESENCIKAVISSAFELDKSQKAALCERLKGKFGKTVIAEYVVDPSLIAGVKVEIDGTTIDGTAAKKLSLVKGAMNG